MNGKANQRIESASEFSAGETDRRIEVNVIREPGVALMTPRKREICWNYGIPPREAPFAIADRLAITLRPGSIVLLSGPSGSGKSSLLNAIAEKAGECVWVGSGRPEAGRPMIDWVASRKTLATAMEILTACGLGEPRLWVRQFGDLSDGEKFRASLACAVGRALCSNASPVIFCDEFTARLHRRLAKAVAYNLRKLVSRHRLMLVVASAQNDIVSDLRPDEMVTLGQSEHSAELRRPAMHDCDGISLQRRMSIESGSVRDYQHFRAMHYRSRDGLGFVDKVFLLRESASAGPLGILVFAHAPLELAMRNLATGGRFIRNIRRLNRELQILRRLVMHPDIRGCGLGHWFVRNTLPQVGVRFVECLAAMGEVNPVFERAGMTRVGPCPMPKGRLKLLERLRAWKLDPFSADFERKVSQLPRVRKLVIETVRAWAGRMHGPMREKVGGRELGQLTQSFRQIIGRPPVYYLWDREGEFPRCERDVDGMAQSRQTTRQREDDEDTRTTREKERHRPDR